MSPLAFIAFMSAWFSLSLYHTLSFFSLFLSFPLFLSLSLSLSLSLYNYVKGMYVCMHARMHAYVFLLRFMGQVWAKHAGQQSAQASAYCIPCWRKHHLILVQAKAAKASHHLAQACWSQEEASIQPKLLTTSAQAI